MKKNDSFKGEDLESPIGRRLKRSLSLSMTSEPIIESFIAGSHESNPDFQLGNQAPKRRHQLPISSISTSEECTRIAKIEISSNFSEIDSTKPSESKLYEAEKAYQSIIIESPEINFNSPGPRAPIRQASSKSLLDLDEDLSINGTESLEIERYFEAGHAKKSSPSSSPKASSSKIESAEKKIADKEK